MSRSAVNEERRLSLGHKIATSQSGEDLPYDFFFLCLVGTLVSTKVAEEVSREGTLVSTKVAEEVSPEGTLVSTKVAEEVSPESIKNIQDLSSQEQILVDV